MVYVSERATLLNDQCSFLKNYLTQIPIYLADDGSGPDKIAHISGPPERCEHAAQIINDLLQSIRVREEGQGVRKQYSQMYKLSDYGLRFGCFLLPASSQSHA